MLMSLLFLYQVKVKKSKKLTKAIKIEEVKIHIFSLNFNEIFGRNITYDNIKSDLKIKL